MEVDWNFGALPGYIQSSSEYQTLLQRSTTDPLVSAQKNRAEAWGPIVPVVLFFQSIYLWQLMSKYYPNERL